MSFSTVMAAEPVFTGGCELITGSTSYNTTAGTRTPQPYYTLEYDFLGAGVMPLGGWAGPYSPTYDTVNGILYPDYVTDEYYGLISDSGINFINSSLDTYANNPEAVKKALELGVRHGVGSFVEDPYIKSVKDKDLMAQRLANYYSYESCLGVHIVDEPSAPAFDGIKEIFDVYRSIDKLDTSGRHFYANLFPSYAGTALGVAGSNYETYCRQFMQKVAPAFLSYDNYPFNRINQGTNVGSAFFNDLATARKVAAEFKVPYWTFVQAGGQWESHMGQPSDPLHPNEGETLWNINTALAFGAKGIQYFTVIQAAAFTQAYNDVDFTRNGMIGAAGNLNQWYYYIQKANKQIAAASPVLMRSASMGIVGSNPLVGSTVYKSISSGGNTGAMKLGTSWRELKTFSASNAIAGCFDYMGRSAFFVVNCSTTAKQDITLQFDKKYGFDVTQRARTVSVAGQNLTLRLENGEGVLVVLR